MLTPLCSSKDFKTAIEALEVIEANETSTSFTSTFFRNVKNKLTKKAGIAVKMKEKA